MHCFETHNEKKRQLLAVSRYEDDSGGNVIRPDHAGIHLDILFVRNGIIHGDVIVSGVYKRSMCFDSVYFQLFDKEVNCKSGLCVEIYKSMI